MPPKNVSRKSKALIEALEYGDDGDDAKKFLMAAPVDSDAYIDLMNNFSSHMRDLAKRAKTCGALRGDEREFVVLKCLLVIAADDFILSTPEFTKTLRNLRKFL